MTFIAFDGVLNSCLRFILDVYFCFHVCWLLCESAVLVLRFVAEGWKWTCLGDSGGILSREVMRGTGGLLGLRGIGVSFFMAPFVFFRGLTEVGDVIHSWGGILLVA